MEQAETSVHTSVFWGLVFSLCVVAMWQSRAAARMLRSPNIYCSSH